MAFFTFPLVLFFSVCRYNANTHNTKVPRFWSLRDTEYRWVYGRWKHCYTERYRCDRQQERGDHQQAKVSSNKNIVHINICLIAGGNWATPILTAPIYLYKPKSLRDYLNHMSNIREWNTKQITLYNGSYDCSLNSPVQSDFD